MRKTTIQSEERHARFPALSQVRLAEEDWELLKKQGFVKEEPHGLGSRFKLRFRREGAQVVRVLRGAEHAGAVVAELRELQRQRELLRELAALNCKAIRCQREVKKQLKPILATYGFVFHGWQIRRSRRPREDRCRLKHGG